MAVAAVGQRRPDVLDWQLHVLLQLDLEDAPAAVPGVVQPGFGGFVDDDVPTVGIFPAVVVDTIPVLQSDQPVQLYQLLQGQLHQERDRAHGRGQVGELHPHGLQKALGLGHIALL